MRALSQPYLRARHPDLIQGNDLIIQTKYPQLVGAVRMFSPTPSSEEKRKEFLASVEKPFLLGKARGYRVYVKFYATLESIQEDPTEEWADNIHRIMGEMAEFCVDCLPEGMRQKYSEE